MIGCKHRCLPQSSSAKTNGLPTGGQALAGNNYGFTSATSFNDCFARCSADGSYCTGVIFLPQDAAATPVGVGPGSCAYKDYPNTGWTSQEEGWVSLIRLPIL